MTVKVSRRVRVQYSSERDFSQRFGYQWWNGSPYTYGQAPPNYPMPAIWNGLGQYDTCMFPICFRHKGKWLTYCKIMRTMEWNT